MNVNHTVDSAEPDDGTEEAPEMKSKPNFEVDIVKPNEKTLSFSCSFVPPSDPHDMQGKDHSEEEAFGKFYINCNKIDKLFVKNFYMCNKHITNDL